MSRKGFSIVLVIIAVLVVVGIGFVVLQGLGKQSESPPIPHSSVQPTSQNTVCLPEERQGIGSPNNALNKTNDSVRKSVIKITGEALQDYYQTYNKAPENLEELVLANLLGEMPLDPQTKQEPKYNPNDKTHVCMVEFDLCEGGVAGAYCIE